MSDDTEAQTRLRVRHQQPPTRLYREETKRVSWSPILYAVCLPQCKVPPFLLPRVPLFGPRPAAPVCSQPEVTEDPLACVVRCCRSRLALRRTCQANGVAPCYVIASSIPETRRAAGRDSWTLHRKCKTACPPRPGGKGPAPHGHGGGQGCLGGPPLQSRPNRQSVGSEGGAIPATPEARQFWASSPMAMPLVMDPAVRLHRQPVSESGFVAALTGVVRCVGDPAPV